MLTWWHKLCGLLHQSNIIKKWRNQQNGYEIFDMGQTSPQQSFLHTFILICRCIILKVHIQLIVNHLSYKLSPHLA